MIKDHASLRHNGFWLQMCDSLLVKRVYRHPVFLTERHCAAGQALVERTCASASALRRPSWLKLAAANRTRPARDQTTDCVLQIASGAHVQKRERRCVGAHTATYHDSPTIWR